jgi:hypothetical protein
MRIRKLERELRVVQELIATARADGCFAEDLLCLEMNRRALLATLSIGQQNCRDDRQPVWRRQLA